MRLDAGIVGFTIVEDVSLVLWEAFVSTGRKVLGVLTLPIGFFVEHVIAQKVKGGPLTRAILGKIAVNAALETVVWVVWLALWPIYTPILGLGIPILAILWLQVALTIEHSLTDNIFHGRPLFANLLNPRVYGFTLLENIGATGWRAIATGLGMPVPAAGWLLTFQYLEHQRAIALARQPT